VGVCQKPHIARRISEIFPKSNEWRAERELDGVHNNKHRSPHFLSYLPFVKVAGFADLVDLRDGWSPSWAKVVISCL
jgi:hypothetical protein